MCPLFAFESVLERNTEINNTNHVGTWILLIVDVLTDSLMCKPSTLGA